MLLAVLVALLALLPGVPARPAPRVLVVGAGIGGASVAYELSLRLPGAAVTVAERNPYVGGRLLSVDFHGCHVNVGGDAWSPANENLVRWARELPVPLDDSDYGGNGLNGLWDGRRFYPPAPPLLGEAELYATTLAVRAALALNYRRLGLNGTYADVPGYLGPGSPLARVAATNSGAFADRVLSAPFTALYWTPLTRTIYDQLPTSTNLFAAVAAVLGSTGTSYSALGGNDAMVRLLLNRSRATLLLTTTVSNVTLGATVRGGCCC